MPQIMQREQDSTHAIYSFAAELMQQGRSCDEICTELVAKGLDQQSATTVVSNLIELRAEAMRKAATKHMLFGALWCIGGLAVTIATYVSATGSREGGQYVVAWGAVLFGGLQFGHGIMQRIKGVNALP